jgi:hypothetical protein
MTKGGSKMTKYFRTKKGIIAADVTEDKDSKGHPIYRPADHFSTDAPFLRHQLITNPTPEEREEGDRNAAKKHNAKINSLWAAIDHDRVAKELI